MPPRVSVNVCCHNSQRYLEATLHSIFTQSFTDWELVIVNDGSTDGTDAIVRRHIASGRPIVYLPQANAGLSASRNEALRRSSGELIAFLDHDDLWEPAKLEKQVPLFDRSPRVGVVYADCINFTEDGYSYRQFQRHPPRRGRCSARCSATTFPTSRPWSSAAPRSTRCGSGSTFGSVWSRRLTCS